MPPRGPRQVLTEKQLKFIQEYMLRPFAGDAAEAAGYDRSAASRLLAHPTIFQEIDRRRNTLREKADYNADKAMRECEDALKLAMNKGQMMAVAKLIELRSKLMGLLVEKMDVRQLTNFRINILGMPESPPNSGLPAIDISSPMQLNPTREDVSDTEPLDDSQFEKEEDIFGL